MKQENQGKKLSEQKESFPVNILTLKWYSGHFEQGSTVLYLL